MVKTYFFIVKSFFENTFFNHIENSHRVIQGSFLSTNLLLNSFAESYWKYFKSKGEHEIFIFGKRNCWRLDSMMKSFLFYFRIFFRRNRLWRDSFKIISSIFPFIFGKKLFNWKYSIRKLLHKKNNFQNTKKTIFELYWKWHSHSFFTFPSLLAKNYWDDVPIIEKRSKLTRKTYLIYFNIRWDFFKKSLSLKKKITFKILIWNRTWSLTSINRLPSISLRFLSRLLYLAHAKRDIKITRWAERQGGGVGARGI